MAGTGSLITRRWNGRGGGRRWCPGNAGVQSPSGAFSFEKVSAPVLLGETDPCGVVLESSNRAGSENVLDDADIEVAGAVENNVGGAQLEILARRMTLVVRSSRFLVPRMIVCGAQVVTSGLSGDCSAVNLNGAKLGARPSCSLQDDLAMVKSSVGRRQR